MTKTTTTDTQVHPGDVWRGVIADTGLSQSAVAEKMGASVAGLSRILRKAGVPSPDLTIKFAEATGSSVTLMWQAVADFQLAEALKARRPVKAVPAAKAPAKKATAKRTTAKKAVAAQ